MKKHFFSLLFLFLFPFLLVSQSNNPSSLILQGIMDFTVPSGGSDGKAIHFVAIDSIMDLSLYGVGVANNGGGSDGEEFSLPSISVLPGEDIFLARDTIAMQLYFDSCYSEFEHVIFATGTSISQNGDDAIELFFNGIVVETFGDINIDGTGTSWEYADSWAYKDSSGSVTFSGGNWIFGGVDCTDFSVTTYSSLCPYPACASQSSTNDFAIFHKTIVYPNPSSDFLFFKNNIENVKVFDSIGKEIKKITVFDNMIEISRLSNGVYFLSINNIKTTFIKN
jgi:hypothetical protein